MTRLPPALSPVWRDQAATSPVCQIRWPIPLPSASNFCGKLSPVCAAWRSWEMSTILAPCWTCARLRQRPVPLASKPLPSKSGAPKRSRPSLKRSRAVGMHFISRPDPLMNTNRTRISTLALGARLPTMHGVRDYVEAGGLMSYGASIVDQYRRAADYVDKILRGAKPGELPIEQPTKFDLVINLTTAKALGLNTSDNLLTLADEVIE